jgi:hypothetical protein
VKKLLSISFAFLIALSVMHITIATHHCGRDNATTEKVSIIGELASCGMEDTDDQCSLPGKYFRTHCCDDKVSVLAVDNNYSPSFSEFKAFSQHILQIFDSSESFQYHSLTVADHISTSVSPPGIFLVSAVSLPDICVFLI